MALQRLRNDPEAGWELRKRTPLWSPDFLMMSPDCTLDVQDRYGLKLVGNEPGARVLTFLLQSTVYCRPPDSAELHEVCDL